MHVTPLSDKIRACQIFINNFSAKNKKIIGFGLVQPGQNCTKLNITARVNSKN